DFFEQIVFFSRHTLNDARVTALTFYLWEDPSFDPTTIFNVWTQYLPDLPAFTQRLAALPDILPGSTPPNDTIPAPPKPVTAPNDAAFGGMSIRVKQGDGRIETMTLENYLRAVVPAEIPATWHPEALKAQAIAARSYAANAIRRARYLGKKFDITTDPSVDQNYRPDKIHIATDKAILATAGLVAIYNRHPIDAVYSANCGGHTRNSEDVFKKADGSPANPTPYLRGVSCPAPGPKNGHGVGLCQHGAQTFAKQGFTFEQILKHYYTGITIELWTYKPPASAAEAESMGITVPGNWQVAIKRTPGLALIVGNLADQPNVPITVTTPRGDSFTVTSGSKPEFGAGGFEAMASGGSGVYRLAFLGQTFSVRVDGNTTVRLDIAAKTTPTESAPQTGSIRGTLTDSLGTPLGGRTVQLQAEHTVKVFATAADGQFLFDDLPPGTYTLSELESGIAQTVTVTGGENRISLVVPAAPGGEHWVAETTELPGNIPLLVGDIGVAGEAITATAPSGATVTVKSGDKPEYGSGGFEIYAPESGTYTLSFLGRTVPVSANGKMLRVTFKQVQPEELARLISSALPLSKIESLLKELRQETDAADLFSIEEVN
ncbi:MAG TPA: SpoIID/LytB domain-containing protein, partial [Anaerolineae bacterium]|nr:SpoIID/LytB domain-containing protein [Anaerolineae bacterium]